MSRLLISIVVGVMVVAGAAAPASAQQACDRACLRTMLDQYLTAVIKHDPAAAPLVVGFRQTENAINVRPGTGVWKTVTGLGKVQRRYLDPVTGQAGYYGTVEEGSETAIVTVRVKVENRKLTEAEWMLVRANDPGLAGPRQPVGRRRTSTTPSTSRRTRRRIASCRAISDPTATRSSASWTATSTRSRRTTAQSR